jgi:hypothetical protein
MLHGDACPVVEGIPDRRITGESSRDDTALAGAPGDRQRHKPSARLSPVAGWLPILSASGVARTIRQLPDRDARIAASRCSFACSDLLSVGSARRPHSLSSWRCGILDLSVDHSHIRRSNEHSNVSVYGLGRSGGDGHRGFLRTANRGRKPANTRLFRILAMFVSRMRIALSGVDTSSHKSRTHWGPRVARRAPVQMLWGRRLGCGTIVAVKRTDGTPHETRRFEPILRRLRSE